VYRPEQKIAPVRPIASELLSVVGWSQGPQRTGPVTESGVSLWVHGLGELLFPFLGQNESLKSLPCHTHKVTTGLSRAETLGLL
jgi:hypothetical protein